MADRDQKMLRRGVAAGTVMGLAIGATIALLIAVRPELFAAVVR